MLVREEMCRVADYHKWAARRWDNMVRSNFIDRDDYLEGADAYARRQASLRRALRLRCLHAWRCVPQWMSMGRVGEGEDEGGADGVGETTVGSLNVGGVGGDSKGEQGHAPAEGEVRLSMASSVLNALESFCSDDAIEGDR